MDLFSELQRTERQEEEELKFDDFESKEKCSNFAKALLECSRQTSVLNPYTVARYGENFVLSGILEGVVTPFSNAVGSTKKKVVIISKMNDKEQPEQYSPMTEAEMLQKSSIQEIEQSLDPPFAVLKRTMVAPSFGVEQKAVYQAQEESFTSNDATSLVLLDLGVRPISQEAGNYFCSMYALCCQNNPPKSLPDLWIVCEEDTSKTICMGCSCNLRLGRLDIYKLIKGNPVVVPETSSYSISLDSGLFSNRIGLRRPVSLKKKHKIATARYEFGPTSLDDISSNSSAVHISIDFIWSGRDACFSPPPPIAEAVASIGTTPGYQMSPVLWVYHELDSLLKFCNIAAGKDSWAADIDSVDEEEVLDSVCEDSLLPKVGRFLEDASSQMLKAVEVSVLSPTVELSPFQPREDLDFLGQLWMFLRHVSNPSDLVDVLATVFSAVMLRRVQPFIHQSKTSTLATLFRQCLSASSSDEREVVATKLQCLLTEEKALQCLVEIGLEKLQRDFVAFFNLSGLITTSDFEPFFAPSCFLTQCHNLCKLQYVLELATILATFVSLPMSLISSFVRDTLKYYRNVEFEGFTPSPLFKVTFPSMSLGTKALAQLASSLKPVAWSVTIEEDTAVRASEGVVSRQRIFCLENPLFKYLMSPSSSEVEDTVMSLYHVLYQSVGLN